MQNIRELAHKHAQYVIDLRHDFHKHPEKSMEEYLQMFPDDEAARRENVFLSSR